MSKPSPAPTASTVDPYYSIAGPRSAIGRAPYSKSEVLGSIPGLVNVLSFLLPLIQEGQLSVTGESMCTSYWWT